MSDIVIPWEEAKKHLEEGDVLLFRAPGFPSIGWAITAYTGGKHSHVAIAHYDNGDWQCIEQREFKGGRSVNLYSQIKGATIDVYRPNKYMYVPTVKANNGGFDVEWERIHFNKTVAENVTRTAASITGQKYGWRNIWEIAKCYLPFFRLYRRPKGDDAIARAYVCSTLVTYSYRKNFIDPCPNLSDGRTTPADIAQSALFHYMFTLGE